MTKRFSPLFVASIIAGSTFIALFGLQSESSARYVCENVPLVGRRCVWVPLADPNDEEGATTGPVNASSSSTNPIASSSTPNYDRLNARASGCYYIRSLNNNFRSSNFRWLDAKSDGTGVGLVSGQSHGTVWLLEETNQGSLLRSTNQNYRSNGNYRWLDGMSNGTGAQLVSDTSHGVFWQLEQVQGGYHIRSLNNNFRNNNFRWLDGASNGSVAQLVNGTSHGTLWELTSTSCS